MNHHHQLLGTSGSDRNEMIWVLLLGKLPDLSVWLSFSSPVEGLPLDIISKLLCTCESGSRETLVCVLTDHNIIFLFQKRGSGTFGVVKISSYRDKMSISEFDPFLFFVNAVPSADIFSWLSWHSDFPTLTMMLSSWSTYWLQHELLHVLFYIIFSHHELCGLIPFHRRDSGSEKITHFLSNAVVKWQSQGLNPGPKLRELFSMQQPGTPRMARWLRWKLSTLFCWFQMFNCRVSARQLFQSP